MLIKNKIILYLNLVLFLLLLMTRPVQLEEIDIIANIINIDKETNIVEAEGSVVAIDQRGNKITADRSKYFKNTDILEAYGTVEAFDIDNNKLTTDKLKYTNKDGKIYSYKNSKVFLNNGYIVSSDSLIYDTINKIVLSNEYSNIINLEEDSPIKSAELENFEYSFISKLFASKGFSKVIDNLNNIYFFDEVFGDTEKKKIVGSNAKIKWDPENVEEASEDNEPRFVSNTAIISEDKSFFKKGVYTQCKQKGDKCPSWSVQAKKITHDKKKKMIYYDHAIVRLFDFPIAYTPKFWHPDPTVKRQSGFLPMSLSDNNILGPSFNVPYFWAISDSKDATLTTKAYAEEYNLYLGEYRNVTKNTSTLLDMGFTKGYDSTSSLKTPGSRSHFFAKSNVDLDLDNFDENLLDITIQRANNKTYFRVHDINTINDTGLVSIEKTNLINDLSLALKKDDMNFNMNTTVYENLTKEGNSRYEYILPAISYGNSLYKSDSLGYFSLKSSAKYRNYDVDQTVKSLINDINWNTNMFPSSVGIVTQFDGQIKNVNYEATSSSYKDHTNHEIASVVAMTNSLPMQKDKEQFLNTLTPKIMFRFAPGHMKNMSDNGGEISVNNIFALNRVAGGEEVVESGASASIGLDFEIDKKIEQIEILNFDGIEEQIMTTKLDKKFSFSVGQVVSFENKKNELMPTTSTLNRNVSDIVSDINYYINSKNKLNYNLTIDKNLNSIYKHGIGGIFEVGKVDLSLDFLEKRKYLGSTNYLETKLNVNFDEENSLNFETRKNFRTDSTEFYDLNYQYLNDCFRARVEFKRTFYNDKDVEPVDTLMVNFTLIPFYQYDSPDLSKNPLRKLRKDKNFGDKF